MAISYFLCDVCYFIFIVQSPSIDEAADTQAASSGADDVPILCTSHEQLPNVPLYTATDYERTLMYNGTVTAVH